MKLTLQLRLVPTPEQVTALRETMAACNAGASYAAAAGFRAQRFSQPSIHKLVYAELRTRFGLSAQMAVRAIGKAVEAFHRDRSRCPVFRPNGAVTYDERILSFKGLDRVSILTLSGRQLIPLVYGAYQRQRLDRLKGQVDLVEREGQFYLYATVDVPEAAPIVVQDFLGVDLGIVQLATDSDGNAYSGAGVERVRQRYARTRAALQRKGTKGAKKCLRRKARRETSFRRHSNHVISKTLVARAKDTGRGLALEDLRGIRSRVTVRHDQRARHSGWAFAQLRRFVEYKAQFAGVPLAIVDPRDSSKTCSACGHCERANRRSQAAFVCRACGHTANADVNAALNLRNRASRAAGKPAPELVSPTA